MRRHLLTVGLLLMTVMGTGCIVVHVEKDHSCKPAVVEPVETTVQEIDAVSQLGFENDRHHAYKRIASRPGLGDAVQIHLIEAVFSNLGFENDKTDVLLTLVGNPCFSPAAEAVLLERIARLGFENDRERILKAIDRRKA